MAFAIGAAHAPSLDGLFTNGLTPRMEQAKYPILSARNESTSRNNTVNMFIDAVYEDYEFAASIVSACNGQTVYAIQCTAAACGPNSVTGILTAGPTAYIFSTATTTQTLGVNVEATINEHCVLGGTTAATCTATAKGTAGGTSVSTTTTTILSGTEYHRYDVEITGGAEKTVNAAATCVAKTPSAGAHTKARALWALAGFVGVVGVLAI